MRKTAVLYLVLMIAAMSKGMAHGVKVDVNMQSPSVIVKSFFSASQPLADALVTIYSPLDNNNAYQTGRTDRAGYFVFIPDVGGEWTFVVDDQKGHLRRTAVSVTDDFFSPEETEIASPDVVQENEPAGIPLIYKLIFGLSVIFGITGILYGIKAKQSPQNK